MVNSILYATADAPTGNKMKLWIVSILFFIFLISNCYALCVEPDIIAYKQCVDEKCGTGYVRPEGCSDTCDAKLKQEQNEFDKCLEGGQELCQKNACQVKVTSDFDGVAADGVSSIRFKLELSGDYEDFDLYIKPREGQTLKGKTEQISDTEIAFTPDEADKDRNYLTPQVVQAIGWCVPIQAVCETEEPDKKYSTKEFTIEQPPLFFVHGIWSSAETWEKFEQRAGLDGWWYRDISYSSKDDNRYNALQLSKELKDFIEKVKTGGSYYGKKISMTKVDLVSHSMGGLITRYYIGSNMYSGNIRKFIMMGTPNHGAWDSRWIRNFFRAVFGRQIFITLEQLRPEDPFIKYVNTLSLNPQIKYYTIAGTSWYTHKGFDDTSITFRGDGVVPVDSVKLEGVPLYCTYDTHAVGVRWIAPGVNYPIEAVGGFNINKDVSLTASEEAYKVAKSLLLTGDAWTGVDCSEEWFLGVRKIAWLKSPATLHAYDEFGNHLGPDKNGKIENTIGDDVIYFSNSSVIEGQILNVIGDRKINFVIKGYETGKIGFDFLGVSANGSVTQKSYENVSIDARTQYTFDPSSENPELVKGELKVEKTGIRWYMLVIAILTVIFGAVLIIKSKKK